MSSGAACSGGGAQRSDSVQLPQRTEPGGPSGSTIDMTQIAPLAAKLSKLGQRELGVCPTFVRCSEDASQQQGMPSIRDFRAYNEVVNAALTISRLRHSDRRNIVFVHFSRNVADGISHASADAMRVAKEAIRGYIDQLPRPAAATESQSSGDAVLNMFELERVPIVEDAENQSAGRQSSLPVGDPTDEDNSDIAPEQENSHAADMNNRRIALERLAKLQEEIDGKLKSQESTRKSLPNNKDLVTMKQRVIDSIKHFTDVGLAIDLMVGAALGKGMRNALNSIADGADFLGSYMVSKPWQSGGFGAARSYVICHKSQAEDLPLTVTFRLKLYGTANREANSPNNREDYYGDQDMRAQQSWAKLVAILSPAEPFPIDDLLAYADIAIETRVKSIKQVGLIKGLPSHDDALEKRKIKEKVKGIRYHKDGAVIRAPVYYRILMIAYLLACVIGAIMVGYYDPAKRKNDYARIADSATFITVTVVTLFTLIKLLFNEPDVLTNLVLGKWVFRERAQVYRYLGDKTMAKKVLAMENDIIDWLHPTDMCFARGRLNGMMELRGGLKSEDLHNIGYVTGKKDAYDFVTDRAYKIKRRNGICIIDKASESETFPGIRKLCLHFFECNTFAGTGTETSLRLKELSDGPLLRPPPQDDTLFGIHFPGVGSAAVCEAIEEILRNDPELARRARQHQGEVPVDETVQPPQRTEPGGSPEGTIDLTQIVQLAVARGTFGQRQAPQEDTLFGIPVPGVGPAALSGSIEEILRNSYPELA